MIRADLIYEDVKEVIMALFTAKQAAAPWDDWRIIPQYPNQLEFRNFQDKKPIIFLEEFVKTDTLRTQGQYLGRHTDGDTYDSHGYRMEMSGRIGIWLHKKHGGPKEMRIIKSHLNNLFDPPTPALPSDTFTITIGGTEFADTTIFAQGILDVEISDGGEIATEDKDEFREEMILTVTAINGESETI